jgi:hypothetical protein
MGLLGIEDEFTFDNKNNFFNFNLCSFLRVSGNE